MESTAYDSETEVQLALDVIGSPKAMDGMGSEARSWEENRVEADVVMEGSEEASVEGQPGTY